MFAYLTCSLVQKFFSHLAQWEVRRRQRRSAAAAARRERQRYKKPTLEWLDQRIVPDAYTYTGPAGGSWTVPGNWSDAQNNHAVPGVGDTATVNPGTSVVLNSSDEQTIAGLTVGGTVTIQSQLTVTPGGSGGGATAVSSSGTLTVATPTIPGTHSLLDTGTLTTAASGSTLTIENNAEVDVDTSGTLSGTTSISGLMIAKNIDAFSGATVTFAGGAGTGGATIAGNGQIDAEVQAKFVIASGGTLTIGPGSPAGSALKGGDVYDSGTMTLNTNIEPVSDIHLQPGGLITGSGSLDIAYTLDWNGGTLAPGGGTEIDGELNVSGGATKTLGSNLASVTETDTLGGSGALMINPGVTFEVTGGQVDVSLPTIMGGAGGSGTFDVSPDGTLNVTASGVTITSSFDSELGSTLKVDTGSSLFLSNGGGVTMTWDPHAYLDGDVTLAGAVSSPSGFILSSGSGALKIGDGVSATGTLTLPSGQTATLNGGELEVSGTGTLAGGGEVSNTEGIMKVDIGGATPGLGTYVQLSSGQLTLEAAGVGVSSALAVTGEADLAGTLNLDLLNGYQPTSGTAFTVLTANPVNHEFNTVPANMTASYGTNTVTLTEN
jgi:hypothetical protein